MNNQKGVFRGHPSASSMRRWMTGLKSKYDKLTHKGPEDPSPVPVLKERIG